MCLVDDFCATLRLRRDGWGIEGQIDRRLINIGLGVPCSRCGGSGSYSYCQQYGDRCFKCGGSGLQAPKLTNALLDKAKLLAEDGTLDAYLYGCQCRAKAKKAVAAVMAAWKETGISAKYDWRNAAANERREPGAYPEDARIAAINARMCAEYDRISAAESAYLNMPDTDRQAKDSAAEGLLTIAKDAIAEIWRLNEEV